MSSPHLSRRSVARGAAWSVPLVAIAITAPAYAASFGTPPNALAKSCKCAGSGPNNWDFKTVLSFDGSGGNFTVVINSWSFDGVVQPNPVPNFFVLTNGDGDVVLSINRTNSSAKHDASVTYTITNTDTGTSNTVTASLVNFVYSPHCAAGIAC
jgi:hypothetical protein